MYENKETIIETIIKAMNVQKEQANNTLYLNWITFTNRKEAFETAMNQTQAMTTRTRRKVTTCLYLKPNNRARSLSTLMAADVRGDTVSNTE